ncbi:hypothetical protein Goshw_009495 [Gossypium schwendimanii]|uniref:PUM-HD domain-containing protein n=2 Tax=Gossypium TaxID=3633 RepID=A0A7J9KKE2_GOSSC|nr:hypothetical protein [Gossypium klotzschianum]MBA0846923.1 hypothetical protein [Gossypium schwendimanii]
MNYGCLRLCLVWLIMVIFLVGMLLKVYGDCKICVALMYLDVMIQDCDPMEFLNVVAFVSPSQAMMKDQFANYVVQKVLETCDDQQRELILSRIKVHLNALKKYTYGKHIVARVEKLVAAGGTNSS